MKQVWKFEVELGPQKLSIPSHGRIVHFGCQGIRLYIWVEVSVDEQYKDIRHLCVVGTGHDIPDDFEHVDTTQVGEFVWHLYESVHE